MKDFFFPIKFLVDGSNVCEVRLNNTLFFETCHSLCRPARDMSLSKLNNLFCLPPCFAKKSIGSAFCTQPHHRRTLPTTHSPSSLDALLALFLGSPDMAGLDTTALASAAPPRSRKSL